MAYQAAPSHDPRESARNAIRAWLRKMSGQKFEGFVVEFLKLLGARPVERTGGAGDGGIDGVGNIGGFRFAFQAKQWGRDVPPRDVRNFVGALTNGGLANGYFFTSSGYTLHAKEEAKMAKKQRITVQLYGGERIAEEMIEKGPKFGVREVTVNEFDLVWWERRLGSQTSTDAADALPPNKTKNAKRSPKRPAKTTTTGMIWDLCDEGRRPEEIHEIAEVKGWNSKTVRGAISRWRTDQARKILDRMPDAGDEDRVAALLKLHIPEKVARRQLSRART